MLIHASTIVTRSPSVLLSHISRLSQKYARQNLLFALSPNFDAGELSNVVNNLTAFPGQSVGCLSAPLPGHNYQERISCSFAFFDADKSTVFRSTIPGRAAPQVGRWHAFRNKDNAPPPDQTLPDGAFGWADIWDGNTAAVNVPFELQHINHSEVNEVVYFSDKAPEGLSNSLAAFPNANKLGLIGSSTPFITGRPVTLFHNDKIYESGAVGIAVRRGHSRACPRTKFVGVTPLSPPMTLTRCEGNMVNSLDGSNPTQLLLNAIRKSGMDMTASGSFKDDETFLLGTFRKDTLSQMYNITAGDPSRGNISLATQNAPLAGTQVQFFHRPKSTLLDIPIRSFQHSITSLEFLTSPETPLEKSDERAVEGEDAAEILADRFLASSENGFIMSRCGDEAESGWMCTVPGGLATLEWE